MHDKWDNLRFVLAVVEHGTLSDAAAKLGSDPGTVEARCRSFETMMGQSLFDKQGDTWRVVAGGLKIISSARDVMLSLQMTPHAPGSQIDNPADTLVVSGTDTLCQFVLPDCLSSMLVSNPRLQLSLISNQGYVSLERLKADISIRPARHLPSEYTGEAAAYFGFALYEVAGGADQWLGYDRELSNSICKDWMDKNVDSNLIVTRANSFVVLSELVKLGVGRTLLPTFVGDALPGLKKTEIDLTQEMVPIYVACHHDMKANRRIRGAMNMFVSALRRDSRFTLR